VDDDAPMPSGSRQVFDPDGDRRGAIPGFAVRGDGTVLYWYARGHRWVPLKPKAGPGGFIKVRIRVGDRVREMGVAAIVLRAFVGPRPLGYEPLHFPDTDPANNRLENLRWAPRGASKVGRKLGPTDPPAPRGDDHPLAALSEADVQPIREMYRAGFPFQEIADRYHVHEETIRNLLVGNTWSHVPDPHGPLIMRKKGPSSEDAPLSRLTQIEADEIRGHVAAGMEVRVVARLYDVSPSTVRDIARGRTWRGDRSS
jgi:hypothetical protein